MLWLLVRGVRAHVKVSRHLVDLEHCFHATALAMIDVNFGCVLDEADFVAAQVVLNIKTEVLSQIND